MKKISAAILAVSLAVSSAAVLTSSAENDDSYSPGFYFKAQPSEDFQILHSGRAYLDTSNAKSDTPTLNVNAYITDEKELVGGFVAKWSGSEGVTLDNLKSPKDVCGVLPYTPDEEYYDISLACDTEKGFISVNYPNMMIFPDQPDKKYAFALTGEKSDDYPFAIFDASLNKSAEPGVYSINFHSNGSGDRCNIIYKPSAKEIIDFVPSGDLTPSLYINVSDRPLGDVNGDGDVDGSDAALALYAYAHANVADDVVDEAGMIAADVDGSGDADGSDASLILAYYANKATTDLSFVDFIDTIVE